MQKHRDLLNLRIRNGECGHPLVRAPLAHHFSNQIAAHIMTDQGGVEQIGSAGPATIRPVAKPACLLKGRFAGSLLCGSGRLWFNVVWILCPKKWTAEKNCENRDNAFIHSAKASEHAPFTRQPFA